MTEDRYAWLSTLSAALLQVRKAHQPDPAGYCRECTRDWPCKTFRLANMETP